MDEPETIKFEEAAVKEYLDNAITFWRIKRDNENEPLAPAYIDAFQSVRISLFGELLPVKEEEND